jgi:hypothetical protein
MVGERGTGLAAVFGLAVASALVLHAMGAGALAAPPLRSWVALDGWYESLGPTTAVVAVVRLGALGAAAWVALASGLQLSARASRSASLRGLADAVSPRFVRSLARGVASLSVTAGLAMPAAAGPPENPPGTAVMVPLDVTTTTVLPPEPEAITSSLPPTTTTFVPTSATTAPAASTTMVPPPPPPPARAARPVPAPIASGRAPAAAGEVVVAAGDSFWSIAVDEADGREVTTYWRALIEANRDRLVDPSNPDLLYPDQVLRLP